MNSHGSNGVPSSIDRSGDRRPEGSDLQPVQACVLPLHVACADNASCQASSEAPSIVPYSFFTITHAACAQEGESPPPEDREFVDDDGTRFVWDSTLRKFRPEDLEAPPAAAATAGAAAPAAGVAEGYTREMMTFGGIEREGVSLEEARAEEEASAERAEQLRGAGGGTTGACASEPVRHAAVRCAHRVVAEALLFIGRCEPQCMLWLARCVTDARHGRAAPHCLISPNDPFASLEFWETQVF